MHDGHDGQGFEGLAPLKMINYLINYAAQRAAEDELALNEAGWDR